MLERLNAVFNNFDYIVRNTANRNTAGLQLHF